MRICHGDELIAHGWHGAGNSKADDKKGAGLRHCINELQRMRPDVVIFGEEKETQAAEIMHTLGWVVWKGPGRGVDCVYTFVGQLPDNMPAEIVGECKMLGQIDYQGVTVGGESLEMTALCALPGVGPKTAAGILADGWPNVPADYMPKCRAAEKVKAALASYDPEPFRLKKVEIHLVTEKVNLSAFGLGYVRV